MYFDGILLSLSPVKTMRPDMGHVKSMVQDPPSVGWSVGSLFPLWGGCGGFGVLGLA